MIAFQVVVVLGEVVVPDTPAPSPKIADSHADLPKALDFGGLSRSFQKTDAARTGPGAALGDRTITLLARHVPASGQQTEAYGWAAVATNSRG